jgi:MoaA/NifB/PqqE/SkfB family radical SAM enzyme
MSNEEQIRILEEKRKKINSVSPSFCSAKWLQSTIYLQNGFNHSCHHPSPHKVSLEEIAENPAAMHNSRYKKEQRQKMLKGIRPKECDYCWKIEDLNKNYFSDRHYKTADTWAWERFDEISQSNPDDDVYPSYLEISFSNVCNFACSYCSPEISSKWMEDIKQNGSYPVEQSSHNLDYLKSIGKMPYLNKDHNPYLEAFWKWFPDAFSHLKVLRITGGEPTLSKDLWKMLDFIEENPRKDLTIAINTNGYVADFLIDRLINKINCLESLGITVEIYSSLESVGTHAEYSRDGLNYVAWCRNIDKFLSNTNCNVIIMTTINVLSLPSFTKFIDLVMEYRKKYNFDLSKNRIPLSINYLRWPPHLQCDILDDLDRQLFADAIEDHASEWLKYNSKYLNARIYLEEFDQIKRFCDYLRTCKTNDNNKKNFVKFITEYDRRRNKNFSLTFPEYAQLIREHNEKKE